MAHIIVPLDGSELAGRALPLAASLAKATGSTLKLVQAAVTPASLDVGAAVGMILAASGEDIEQQGADAKKTFGVDVATRAALEFPDRLILQEAAAPGAIAIVMTTHGRTGLLRLARGSVAESVLRQSPIPVYLVPAAAPAVQHASVRRILVPLDGSVLAHSVLGALPPFAKHAGAQLTLLRVYSEEEKLARAPEQTIISAVEHQLEHLEDHAHAYFASLKAHLRSAGVMVEAEWEIGDPATEILAAADRLHADLIALATHGRSGVDRLRCGSVAEAVLRHSTRPVMTFGPEAIRRLAAGVGPAEAKLAQTVVV